MWNMLWPILVVVTANTLYHISAKSTPAEVNSFASLTITYAVAGICSLAMFFFSGGRDLAAQFAKTNWTAWLLGIIVVGLEFGSICVYRAGWKLGVSNLVTSVSFTCVLLLVGVFFYKEAITLRQILGICVCALGLVLVLR